MINKHDEEIIGQFLGSYFHQDWDMEFASVKDAVQSYKTTGYEPNEILNLANALRAYAQEIHLGKIGKRVLFREFACFYDPGLDGISEGDWLASLADDLTEGMKFQPKAG